MYWTVATSTNRKTFKNPFSLQPESNKVQAVSSRADRTLSELSSCAYATQPMLRSVQAATDFTE
eukprot:1226589-Rhodomonas_salina.2